MPQNVRTRRDECIRSYTAWSQTQTLSAFSRGEQRWLELAAATAVVPERPGSKVGYCAGVLFVGIDVDVVRAAVLTTSRLRDEVWPTNLLADLARRGSAHDGMAGFPEALALKVASAAVDALVLRANEVDHAALASLLTDLRRRDLIKRINAALP